MKKMILCFLAMIMVLALPAQSVYDFTVKDIKGNDVSLANYKGKVLLIENTKVLAKLLENHNPTHQKL